MPDNGAVLERRRRHGCRVPRSAAARFAVARRDPRPRPARRDRGGRRNPRRRRNPARCPRPDRRHRPRARRRGAPRAPRQGRHRRLFARIRAVLAGGGGAPVPRRGVATHPRRRNGRPADPRQARRGRLGAPSRPVGFDLCQRLDLGIDADRAPPARRTGSARFARGIAPFRDALGRAGGAPGGDRGDAHSRAPIRHGAHDRGGARPRPAGRTRRLSPLLRHARRSGAHRFRRRPLSRRLRKRHRRDRACRGRRHCRGGAGHLGQVVGIAPALRDGAARARIGRNDAAIAGARPRCARRPGSASRSTPRRPTGSTCRST